MFNGDVGGVSGNGDVKWNKKLAEELDKLDGNPGDGKINANIWNKFMKKTGSKGNKIRWCINLNNAEKSFNYYDKKKDVGKVDWKNWEAMLNEFKADLGVEIHNKPVDNGEGNEENENKVKPEQQTAFDELENSGAIAEKKFDAESLKSGGFGSTKTSEIMSADENGLYYVLDMNGGKTYVNEAGESIRISEFEAKMVEGGKVSVTHTSADGKTSNTIIYGEDGKPISGTATVKNADNTITVYSYDYVDGKKVLKECKVNNNSEETGELTEAQKEEFKKNSPLKEIKNAADFEKTDLSKYEWNLQNYQGTGFYLNKETGERIDVERSFGPGGYKNLSLRYTKDGITHEIKFDDNGNIASEEVRKAATAPDPVIGKDTTPIQPDPVIGENTTPIQPDPVIGRDTTPILPTKQELQQAVESLPIGKSKMPTEAELIQAGYVKNEEIMTGNGGILFSKPATNEVVILTDFDKTMIYVRGNTQITQNYDQRGKAISGEVIIKGEAGAFAVGEYTNDTKTGVPTVTLQESHNAPRGSFDFANEGIEGHKNNIAEFRKKLGIPDDFNTSLPELTHAEKYHGEHTSDDGNYLTKVDVDAAGNVKIAYLQKQEDGTFKELGTITLAREISESSLRGYDYKFTAHNSLTNEDTVVSSASWQY